MIPRPLPFEEELSPGLDLVPVTFDRIQGCGPPYFEGHLDPTALLLKGEPEVFTESAFILAFWAIWLCGHAMDEPPMEPRLPCRSIPLLS